LDLLSLPISLVQLDLNPKSPLFSLHPGRILSRSLCHSGRFLKLFVSCILRTLPILEFIDSG
jgi:hypothetical protein